MPNYLLLTHNTLFRKLRFSISFALCFLIFSKATAQNIPDDFREKIQNLIQDAPKNYGDIDARLKREKHDTVLMRYMAQYAKSQEYFEGQAYAHNNLGRMFRNLSLFKKAEVQHKLALELSEKAKSLDFEILSLNWLAVVHRKTDAIRKALDAYQKALQLAENIEDPTHHIERNINVSLNGIGNLYKTLGQYDLAIEQFERAISLDKKLENKLGLAINHLNIGECQELKGELENALENYRKSLAFNEEINSNMGSILCKNSIAQIYLKQGMPNAALVLLEPIKNKALELGDNSITSSVYLNLGWAQMKLNNLTDSEVNLEKGLQMAQQYKMPSIVLTAYQRLSELETSKGNHRLALEYFKTADTIGRKISDDQNLRYMSEVIERYESDKKSTQIAALAKENEEAMIRLRKNQTTYLVSALALGLLASILYILYRKYQSSQEKRVLSLEQNMLRSQMNPHFLFNSLNSIKLYIINNEQKNAVHYLNKFSKLVRKILEASSSKEISLAEELETVELYMNIENIRFNSEIDFKIEVDKNVDLDFIKIPSLALQPFLENALWHGLSPKDGDKKIRLGVANENNGHVTIAIEDNGVGRAAAEINKENRVLKRKSVGIDITKERLANFAKDYQNNFDVEIVDLFDDTGHPRGTRVTIDIPVF